ncbi:MAG: TRAP transporter large permease subunit, partial [Rubrivivax sp.]
LYRRFTWAGLYDSLLKTARVTAMIMAVLLGGTLFTGVFIGGGGINLASTMIDQLSLGPWGLIFLLLLILFIAGFFLDWISIVLIFLPIFTPLVTAAGFDPVWFCILFLIMIQTSYLTPPMAPAIFYLRAVAPPEITMRHMYAGMVPFIGLQLLVLASTLYWPELVTWLPQWAMQLR